MEANHALVDDRKCNDFLRMAGHALDDGGGAQHRSIKSSIPVFSTLMAAP
jgi:hypothetical protein